MFLGIAFRLTINQPDDGAGFGLSLWSARRVDGAHEMM
jgi:hypothetical protein